MLNISCHSHNDNHETCSRKTTFYITWNAQFWSDKHTSDTAEVTCFLTYHTDRVNYVMYITWHSTQVRTIKSSQHKFFTSGVLTAMTTEMTVFWNVQFDRYLSLIYLSLHYKYLSQIWHTFGITCWEFSWVTHFLTLLRIGTICVFIHHNTHSVNFNII